MTAGLKSVLIIGGGFSGMSAAIQLRKIGIDVDLIEIDPDWRTDGAGLTMSGPSLRALESIGVLPQFVQQGAITDGVDIYTADGVLIKSILTLPLPNSSAVGGGGIMRPTLAKILAGATMNAGVNVRLGCTYTAIKHNPDAVEVTFTDGSTKTYDFVIGADGLFSTTRQLILPNAPTPKYTGQGVWRAVVAREDVKRAIQFLGKKGKVGFTPISESEMYLYYTEARSTKDRIGHAQSSSYLKELLAEFNAPVVTRVRESLDISSQIFYRPLEGMMVPRPWFSGRVLLIGDCVHATTPHLASGAGMGVEDAVVLSEEIQRGGELPKILERYQNRRWERCRMVVANSLRLGEIEKNGGLSEEHGQIMALSMSALMAPI